MRYWESARPKRTPKKRSAPRAAKRSIASGGSLREYPFLRTFYQHQAVISDRVQKFLFVTLIATLLYAFVFGESGAIRIATLKHERSTLETDLAQLRADSTQLATQTERLKNDPFYIEKIARERYGYVRPGDRVYKLILPQPSP